MGHPVDETRDRDAQPIGDEEPTHDERASEANAREGEPAEAAALEADDEYEMVDPSELVDVPKEEPPRTMISSVSLLTMSGTVPPIPKPSKDRSGDRDRAWSTKRAATAAAIAAALAAAFFGVKRGSTPTSAPSREVAAAIATPEPRPQPEAVASDTIATAAAVPAPETPQPTPSPSPAATEHQSKVVKESPPAENHKNAQPSAADRAELAAMALQVGASKAAACTMNFNTIPPSRVALDGRDLGMTPKIGVSVPPGTHIVTFANAGGKKVTSAPCKPGEQKTVSMRLSI